jgi:hypothetical protein
MWLRQCRRHRTRYGGEMTDAKMQVMAIFVVLLMIVWPMAVAIWTDNPNWLWGLGLLIFIMS